MKYLGIDYGTKRVGLAISDESGTLARPLETINSKGSLDRILQICKDELIQEIVIGKSLNIYGGQNDVQELINEFVVDLTIQTPIPIHFQDEAFSSHVAHGSQGKEMLNATKNKISKTENLDAKAAAVILQRYLDKKLKNKNI